MRRSKRVSFSKEITVKEFLKARERHENSPDMYTAPMNYDVTDQSSDMELSTIGSPSFSAIDNGHDHISSTTIIDNQEMELTQISDTDRGEMTLINPNILKIQNDESNMTLMDDSNMDISSEERSFKLDQSLFPGHCKQFKEVFGRLHSNDCSTSVKDDNTLVDLTPCSYSVRRSLRVRNKSNENTNIPDIDVTTSCGADNSIPLSENTAAISINQNLNCDDSGSFFKPLIPKIKKTPIVKVSTSSGKRKSKQSKLPAKIQPTHVNNSIINTSESNLSKNEVKAKQLSFTLDESLSKNNFSNTNTINLLENSGTYNSEVNGSSVENTIEIEDAKERAAERQRLINLKAELDAKKVARIEESKLLKLREEQLSIEVQKMQELVPSAFCIELMNRIENFQPPKFTCEEFP